MDNEQFRNQYERATERFFNDFFKDIPEVIRAIASRRMNYEIMMAFYDGQKSGLDAWRQFIDKRKDS